MKCKYFVAIVYNALDNLLISIREFNFQVGVNALKTTKMSTILRYLYKNYIFGLISKTYRAIFSYLLKSHSLVLS